MDASATEPSLIEHVLGWDIFAGLLVFPLAALLVRLWQTRGHVCQTKGAHLSLFDRVMPSRGATRSVISNIALTAINAFGWGMVFFVYSVMFDGFWTETVGLERIAMLEGLWLPVQIFAVVAILDLSNYWSHRLLHRPWMWGVHQLHHSDQHMNYSTSNRIHFIEGLQMNLVGLVTIGWFTLPAEALVIGVAMRGWYGMYVHSNLPFDHGPLRRVLVSPNYHAWHHCDDPAVYGRNLADVFPVWDIIFGTHHDPGRCDVPLGVSDAPDDIIAGQIYPLRYWWGLWRGRARRSDALSSHQSVAHECIQSDQPA